MKEITVQVPDGKRAEWINGALTLVDEPKVDNRPVMERIKTLADALRELGTPEEDIEGFFDKYKCLGKDVMAYLKLRVIAEALNEGWKPLFTTDEYHYYPWFLIYTEEELKNHSEEWKKAHVRWFVDGNANTCAYCVLAYADSDCAILYSPAYIGARLAVKSKDLAVYFGKQFIDIWIEYLSW